VKGIVLLAHGSRDPQWVSPFETVRAIVQSRAPGSFVALAYLEQSVPNLTTAVDQLVLQGATSITVVPLFLGPGGHVRNDVPQLVDRAQARHESVRFSLKPFIGDERAVLDAIADYALS
jgi:sirohydrochlorin cobaltochelatase